MFQHGSIQWHAQQGCRTTAFIHSYKCSQLQGEAGMKFNEILIHVSTIQPHTRHLEVIAQVDARFTHIQLPFLTLNYRGVGGGGCWTIRQRDKRLDSREYWWNVWLLQDSQLIRSNVHKHLLPIVATNAINYSTKKKRFGMHNYGNHKAYLAI